MFPLDLATRTSSSLYIPAGSLKGGSTYRFTLTATNSDLLEYVGQATVSIQVLELPLQPVIHSGTRYLSRYAEIELDGSASFDPNGLDGNLTYAWSCQWVGNVDLYYGDNCPASRHLDTEGFKKAKVTLPSSVLPPGDWLFTLTISKGERSASAQQLITIAWKDAPTVFVRLSSAAGHSYDELPSNIPLRFEATASTALGRALGDLVWTLSDGDMNLTSPGVVQEGNEATTLVINPGVLTPGAQYRLKFSAIYAEDVLQASDWAQEAGIPWASSVPSTEGWAEIVFSIGAYPWGGSCSVTPVEAARYQIFDALCYGFDTARYSESAPLLFHYYVRHSGDDLGGLFPLGSHTSVSAGRLQTYLPSTLFGATIDLYARIFDRSGSPAFASGATDRLISVASGIYVGYSPNEGGTEALVNLYDSSVNSTNGFLSRVDIIPTVLYSYLHDLNYDNTTKDFSRNPFTNSLEVEFRQKIFNLMRRELALERSEDSTTVQTQLLYLVSGGRRPPVPAPSPSPSPSPVAASTSPSPTPLESSMPRRYYNKRATDYYSKRATSNFDLGVEIMSYLHNLTLGTLRSSDRIVRFPSLLLKDRTAINFVVSMSQALHPTS